MRAVLIGAAVAAVLVIANRVAADPPRHQPAPVPIPRPRPTVPIKVVFRFDPEPIIIDAQQVPRVNLVPLSKVPRCRKDRRGIQRCRVTR